MDEVILKSGVEIHQQLDTSKLFCNCPSILRQDEPDYVAGRSKFDASVASILKAEVKVSEKKAEDKFADMERNLRSELGLDSVDKSASAGAGDSSDEAFEKKMADPDYVATPGDLKRIKELLKKI